MQTNNLEVFAESIPKPESDRPERMEMEKKAALAVEVADMIAARAGDGASQKEVVEMALKLLFGWHVRISSGN
jgi:hypothetical protein